MIKFWVRSLAGCLPHAAPEFSLASLASRTPRAEKRQPPGQQGRPGSTRRPEPGPLQPRQGEPKNLPVMQSPRPPRIQTGANQDLVPPSGCRHTSVDPPVLASVADTPATRGLKGQTSRLGPPGAHRCARPGSETAPLVWLCQGATPPTERSLSLTLLWSP